MADWIPISLTDFKQFLSTNTPPPLPRPPAVKPVESTADDVAKLNQWFQIYWIGIAAGLPLLVICIGLGGLVVSVVFQCFILHKLWSMIPADEAQTTPGKAVGFLFIPFFNFYWNFIAFHGLAQALNTQTERYSIPNGKVDENLSLIYCILICCSLIPYVNFLTGIGVLVIGIILLKEMKDAGIALIQQQTS